MGKIGKVVGKMGLHNKAFKTTQRKLKTGKKKKTNLCKIFILLFKNKSQKLKPAPPN